MDCENCYVGLTGRKVATRMCKHKLATGKHDPLYFIAVHEGQATKMFAREILEAWYYSNSSISRHLTRSCAKLNESKTVWARRTEFKSNRPIIMNLSLLDGSLYVAECRNIHVIQTPITPNNDDKSDMVKPSWIKWEAQFPSQGDRRSSNSMNFGVKVSTDPINKGTPIGHMHWRCHPDCWSNHYVRNIKLSIQNPTKTSSLNYDQHGWPFGYWHPSAYQWTLAMIDR